MGIERFYIIKNGSRDGPFDESYVRFLLENEEIGFGDFCETEDGERFRLGTLYEPVDDGGGVDGEGREPGAEDEDGDGDVARVRPGKTRHPRQLVYVGHPSFINVPLAWLAVIIGAVGGFLLGPHSLWGMLAGFGLASAAIFYIVLVRAAHLYVITSRRIEAIHGLLAKDSMEIRVEDIRTINVKRNGIAGVLGVGTVEFSSTGDAIDVAFRDVWRARRIKKLVRKLQDASAQD